MWNGGHICRSKQGDEANQSRSMSESGTPKSLPMTRTIFVDPCGPRLGTVVVQPDQRDVLI